MKIPTVEASDDRLDALLVFTAVDRRFHQQARGGGATIALIHEQAPHECDVQALQMKMTGQRDGTRKHVGLKDAPDTGSLDDVAIKHTPHSSTTEERRVGKECGSKCKTREY